MCFPIRALIAGAALLGALAVATTARADGFLIPQYTGSVLMYSAAGQNLGTFAAGLSNVTAVAVNPTNGDVFIGANTSLLRYTSSGTFLGSVALTGFSAGAAAEIKFGPNGNLYVPEYLGTGIHVFSPTLANLGYFATGDFYALAFDASGNAYTASYSGTTLRKFSANGTDLGVIATLPGENNGFAFDSQGILYAGSRGGGTVTRYSATGTNLGTVISGFSTPIGVVRDSNETLLVGSYNGTIQRFTTTGTNLGTFASGLSSPTFFARSTFIAAAPEPGALAFIFPVLPVILAVVRRRKGL